MDVASGSLTAAVALRFLSIELTALDTSNSSKTAAIGAAFWITSGTIGVREISADSRQLFIATQGFGSTGTSTEAGM